MSICFQKVTQTFGSKIVLKEVSFEVPKGKILFILGKSGVGKSVTLKLIVGMLKASSGQVLVDGQDVMQLQDEGLAQVRRKCGMVFQYPALLDSLTLYENLSFGLRPFCTPNPGTILMSEAEIRKTVLEKLSLVHLGPEILELFPHQISYGMQKRISLARTLAPEPHYLLFDEPTTGLDPITTQAVNDLIFDLSRKLKVTSIVVSHDMACALQIADQILVLDEAQIIAQGTVDEIKQSSVPLVQEFLKETLALFPLEENRSSTHDPSP